ncbi:MAG TPA: hypothetical protein VFK15_01250 [Burkholderiales bacterium]|jgi:hypothetical protein|nr:hypothetical protein [Burkholderiales bacterium]
MRAFEIHTYQGGKWKIDSVFDDRDLAVFEAQRMEGSKRYLGVRVVEETFDENTQQTAVRTIYRGIAVESASHAEHAKKQQATARGAKPAVKGGAAPRRHGKGPAPPKQQKSNGLLLAIFSVIIVVGLGAIVALRLMSSNM